MKRVDFCITHDTGETSSTSSQSDVQRKDVSTTQCEDKPIGDLDGMIAEDTSQKRETLHTDERRQSHNVTSLEIRDMDITTPDHDIYYGIYPDFQLPLPDQPRISDFFAGNTFSIQYKFTYEYTTYTEPKKNVWYNRFCHRPINWTTV